jgi:hypothetical protein
MCFIFHCLLVLLLCHRRLSVYAYYYPAARMQWNKHGLWPLCFDVSTAKREGLQGYLHCSELVGMFWLNNSGSRCSLNH